MDSQNHYGLEMEFSRYSIITPPNPILVHPRVPTLGPRQIPFPFGRSGNRFVSIWACCLKMILTEV